ncbi:penicillin acylase family protein [Peribacillus butanolivorans]|uniref:penicillin acylase family protein n=1 Tax=Peribacillus butanolivorans TaxID=421767 RepID=UPI0036DAF508
MILYLKLQVTSINTRGSPAVSKIDERIPTPGTGEYEWKGFIPFKENPHVINPKNGYVVNWNNKPAKEWTNGEYSFYWGEDNRVQQYIGDGSERESYIRRYLMKLIIRQALHSYEQTSLNRY